LAIPMHLEARGTYFFGDDPLAREGLSLYAVWLTPPPPTA